MTVNKAKAQSGRTGFRQGRALATSLLATSMLAGSAFAAHAAAAAATPTSANDATTIAEVVVTAEKREESLQKVSASILALDTKTLEQRNVSEFQDYVKFLPSVSIQSTAPSATQIYMRGVASGENANHSGPLPSVGLYLDEQSVTTIGGALDIHIYDVARIESLAGPQGTLYGASSESGTVRIITNKPTTAGFKAGYDVQASTFDKGGQSFQGEGFVNIPLSENTAVRLVGWADHDGGYIDNVLGSRTFATSGATLTNANLVKKNFNPVDTVGGRAALKVDLNDTWTVNTSILAQDQRQRGVFNYEPSVGDLKVQRFLPDTAHDRFYQASLTVNGKISNFDVTYTAGYFQRQVNTTADYTDYTFHYDRVFGSGAYWTDNAGNALQTPQQYIIGKDRFDKQSQELRIASPATDRLRFVGGLFEQRQSHWIVQDYTMKGFADSLSVPGWGQTIWLTDQMRVDRDQAAFGQLSYDLTSQLILTGGLRAYHYKNSLVGFFGFSGNFDDLLGSSTGMNSCFSNVSVRGGPCTNVHKTVADSGTTYKVDLTYKFSDTKQVYGTVANGYRPGGINRAGNLPPYAADELTSYELGWKTSWMDRKLRFNGAVYYEDWKNFQFSFLGLNSLTQVANAGQATIYGLETDFAYVVTPHLTLSGAGAYTHAELGKEYCKQLNDPVCPDSSNTDKHLNNLMFAPKGQQLPVTPDFKANLTLRYTFDIGDWYGHAQTSAIYSDKAWSDLRTNERGVLGQMPAYSLFDFSVGAEKGTVNVEFFIKNAFDDRANLTRTASCPTVTSTYLLHSGVVSGGVPLCGAQPYITPQQPRTFGVRFGQKF